MVLKFVDDRAESGQEAQHVCDEAFALSAVATIILLVEVVRIHGQKQCEKHCFA